VEHGTITLIGATTENPSFEVIGPLLSRCRVFVLDRLSPEAVDEIVERALTDKERGLNNKVKLGKNARKYLLDLADGDARAALNLLEMASLAAPEKRKIRKIDRKLLEQSAQKRLLSYDKDREWHLRRSACSATIRTGNGTIISSLRFINPCAAAMWMQASTGWPGCSRVVKTRSMLPGAS
jgi:putative ATPase